MNYIEKLKHLHQRSETGSTVQPGDRIAWVRADGTRQNSLIDMIHVDEDGQHWAFVTLGESWAVVNMKFVSGSGDE